MWLGKLVQILAEINSKITLLSFLWKRKGKIMANKASNYSISDRVHLFFWMLFFLSCVFLIFFDFSHPSCCVIDDNHSSSSDHCTHCLYKNLYQTYLPRQLKQAKHLGNSLKKHATMLPMHFDIAARESFFNRLSLLLYQLPHFPISQRLQSCLFLI